MNEYNFKNQPVIKDDSADQMAISRQHTVSLAIEYLVTEIDANGLTQEEVAAIDELFGAQGIGYPNTVLSNKFELEFSDHTETIDGVVTGSIDVRYKIPADMDLSEARDIINQACYDREDRCTPFWRGDLIWYTQQDFEKSGGHEIKRDVEFTIDFDSNPGNGTMNMAGHRAYAESKDCHITPVALVTIGDALYYEKTGLHLTKGYNVRAVVSDNVDVPGVTLANDTVEDRVVVVKGVTQPGVTQDDLPYEHIVVALSKNSK